MSSYQLRGVVRGTPVSFVLDTGATVSLFRKDTWDRTKSAGEVLKPWTGKRLVGVEGTALQVYGTAEVPVEFAGETFQVRTIVADALTTEAILGLDFMEAHGCTLDTREKQLQFADRRVVANLSRSTDLASCAVQARVTLEETVRVPGLSEMEVTGTVRGLPAGVDREVWLMEGERSKRMAAMVANAVVKPNDNNHVPVRLVNPREETVTIHRGTRIATLEDCPACVATDGVTTVGATSEAEPVISQEKQKMLWEMVERSGDELGADEKEQLYLFLLSYADVFASDKADFGRTNKVEHRIDTGGAAPIRQPLRRIPPFQREEARKLLDEMLQKDVIQPSSSPWASPIILVRKKDGSFRFCVDYRRVNAVTKKDAYPLPRIDDTLDTVAGARWFSSYD